MKKKIFGSLLVACVVVAAVLGVSKISGTQSKAASDNLLNTYGSTFGKVGNCVSLSQLQNPTTLSHIKEQYNSVTLENEMKPDYILGSSANLISVADAKALGYYIPSNYTESKVPKLNFSTVDKVLEICHNNGLSLRAHTLVWHSQTPSWLFATGYTSGGSNVSSSVMDARMEFYIKTVMSHVYNSSYGDCVYAWDVVNEYLHASNSGWLNIYGNISTNSALLKKAFTYANESLKSFGLDGKVKLFYNDYNTYMEASDIVTLIGNINSNGKVCDGVGMQAHLDTSYPSVSLFSNTIKTFKDAKLEIQITELDVTCSSTTTQATYYYDLMKAVLAQKKAGANITGITWWGLYDSISWRSSKSPLLFSSLGVAKNSYNKVMQAYSESGMSSATTAPTTTVPTTKAPTTAPTTATTTKAPTTEQPTATAVVSGDVAAKFAISSEWNSGYICNVTITNNSSSTVNGWTLFFKLADNISSAWGINKVTSNAGVYTMSNLDWNKTIAPGQSISFGFMAAKSGETAGQVTDITIK